MRHSINKKKYQSINLLIFLIAIIGIACGSGDLVDLDKESINTSNLMATNDKLISEPATLKIVTTTDILKEWVNITGGSRVEVHAMVPRDSDPHGFRLTPKDVAKIENADAIFLIGSGYEDGWLYKLSNTVTKRVINLSEHLDMIALSSSTNIEVEKVSDHDNDNGALDPHFWHDPNRVIDAIEIISLELSDLDPEAVEYFGQNASNYVSELKDLDNWIYSYINKIPIHKRLLITNHRTMSYFAHRYDFTVLGDVIDSFYSNDNPTPRDIVDILDLIDQNNVKVIFGEPQMEDKIMALISEETGIMISVLHSESLGAIGSEADNYIGMMKKNVNIIVDGLGR
jgi:ABC-type Zn uptake system ZnuABC Zn-binding protein ZnuA